MHSQLNFAAFLCLLSIREEEEEKIIRKHSQTMLWKRNVAVAPKVSFPPPTEIVCIYTKSIVQTALAFSIIQC